MRKSTLHHRGFTLMELLIVIAILGILGVAFVPNILKAPAKARDAVRVKKVQDVYTAIEAYYAEHGTLPVDENGIEINGPCLTNTLAVVVGMQSEPIDPNKKNSCHTAGSEDKYLYMIYHVNVNGLLQKRYLVGALTEVPTSANSTVKPENINAFAEVFIPILSPGDDGTYFMASGPI